MKKKLFVADLSVGLLLIILASCQRTPLPIPPLAPTATFTPTRTIAMTSTPTVTATATLTATMTPARTLPPTLTPALSFTFTPTPSATGTPTKALTPTTTSTPGPCSAAQENLCSISLINPSSITCSAAATLDVEINDCMEGDGDFTVIMAIRESGACTFTNPYGNADYEQGVRNMSDFQDVIVSSNGYGTVNEKSGINYYYTPSTGGCTGPNGTLFPVFNGYHFCIGTVSTCLENWLSQIDTYPTCGTGSGPGVITLSPNGLLAGYPAGTYSLVIGIAEETSGVLDCDGTNENTYFQSVTCVGFTINGTCGTPTATPTVTATFTFTPSPTPSTTTAPNCSSSAPVTTLNNMQLSQFVMYSGLGYGYTAATTSFPYNGDVLPSSGSIAVSGIPAGAVIVSSFLEMLSVACNTAVTVDGTAFTGSETGYANTSYTYTNSWYNTTSMVAYGTNYCNTRYNVTAVVTANGSYNLAFAATPEVLTASLIVVYQVPGATATTTVSIADGLYFWLTGDGNGNYLMAGMNPVMTSMSLCSACGGSPSNDSFTRIGGGGLWNTSDAGDNGAGNDLFLNPSSSPSSPTTLLSEPTTALGNPSNDAAASGGPPYANLDTYNLTGTTAVPSGATSVSWGLGDALPNWGLDTADAFWVNVLVNSETCP